VEAVKSIIVGTADHIGNGLQAGSNVDSSMAESLDARSRQVYRAPRRKSYNKQSLRQLRKEIGYGFS
jgi:hypothetical protein